MIAVIEETDGLLYVYFYYRRDLEKGNTWVSRERIDEVLDRRKEVDPL